MGLAIAKINNNSIKHNNSFTSKKKVENKKATDENPISRKGETMNLIKATFIGGLALGARLLWGLVEEGCDLADAVDMVADGSKKLSKRAEEKLKKPLKTPAERAMFGIGAFVSILIAGLCGFALLYTAANAPKIAYKSKVNTFKKQKEMDVYIKGNQAERELYTQLNDEAKNADTERKKELKEDYAKLQLAKNQVPDFV